MASQKHVILQQYTWIWLERDLISVPDATSSLLNLSFPSWTYSFIKRRMGESNSDNCGSFRMVCTDIYKTDIHESGHQWSHAFLYLACVCDMKSCNNYLIYIITSEGSEGEHAHGRACRSRVHWLLFFFILRFHSKSSTPKSSGDEKYIYLFIRNHFLLYWFLLNNLKFLSPLYFPLDLVFFWLLYC